MHPIFSRRSRLAQSPVMAESGDAPIPMLPLAGGCNCGAVRYAVSEKPRTAGYCHSRRCQRRTGTAASPSAKVVPGSFRITQGEEAIRAWCPEDGFEKHFCGECGSHLFSRDPDDHENVGVRMGTFDSDPGVRPERHSWVGSAAVWESIPDDGLPRFETQDQA